MTNLPSGRSGGEESCSCLARYRYGSCDASDRVSGPLMTQKKPGDVCLPACVLNCEPLFDTRENVILVHEQVRFSLVLDLGARILGEQYAIAYCEIRRHVF